jgi:alpha-1,2-mannosyltransferase
MNLFEAADASLKRLRSSAAGEPLWALSLGAMMAVHLASLVPAFLRPELIDFSAFVDNARAWLSGMPYPETSRDPNTPHAILAFVPFVYLPLRVGLAIWTVLTYLSLALTLRAVSRELGLRLSRPLQLTLGAFALATPPSRDVFVNGNMIWPLALAFTWAWRLARRDRLPAAAAVLGVLATMKPFLGMFGLLFLVRREWRALGAMAAASVVSLAVAVALTDADAFEAWLQAVGRISWYAVRFNASAFGFLARVRHPEPMAWAAVAIAIATITYAVLKSGRASLSREWLFVFIAALLAAPLGWRYYVCLAVGPLVATLLSVPGRNAVTASLCIVMISPTIPLVTNSTILLATLGSIPMWAALTAWAMLATTGPGPLAEREST